MPKKKHKSPIDPAELRRAREAAGLSQQKLADLVGCGRTEICAYENGRKSPGQRRLDQIADALGLALISLDGGAKRFVRADTVRQWLDGVNRP